MEDTQSPAVETRHQIWDALPLDADVWCQDVVADSERDGDDQEMRRVQQRRQGGAELPHVDDDLHCESQTQQARQAQPRTREDSAETSFCPPAILLLIVFMRDSPAVPDRRSSMIGMSMDCQALVSIAWGRIE